MEKKNELQVKSKDNDIKSSPEEIDASLRDLSYPAEEDILTKKNKVDLDIEKISSSESDNIAIVKNKDLSPDPAEFDEGLDVPGTDLDDEEESSGEEDEENNFYSLGGNRHNDLDESEDASENDENNENE
jgi:hypothetical protein